MVVIFAQNISIVSSGMSPPSQLPPGLVDSTLLSSLMTILEPRGSFTVKYLGGKEGKTSIPWTVIRWDEG